MGAVKSTLANYFDSEGNFIRADEDVNNPLLR